MSSCSSKSPHERIVITGVGLTAPNGNGLADFRQGLLTARSGVRAVDMRYFGPAPAGLCDFDALKYQRRRDLRTGTRAGSIAIFCTGEALADSGLAWEDLDPARTGVFLGITEHGNAETENEIYEISQYGYDTRYWSHHHNPRTVANNPAGEVTVRFGLTGPHYTVGAACAAGNLGLVTGAQQLLLAAHPLAAHPQWAASAAWAALAAWVALAAVLPPVVLLVALPPVA